MKTGFKVGVHLPLLLVVLAPVLANRVAAQTFTTLHTFSRPSVTNTDGTAPNDLLLLGTTLYGTAGANGLLHGGTLFKLNTDGTGFMVLHDFDGTNGSGSSAGLTLSGNSLYGMTHYGGISNAGSVFSVGLDGTKFSVLYQFTGGSDGGYPWAGLLVSSNRLYGTAYNGGSFGSGTVFALNTDGTGFTVLHSFTALAPSFPYINSDGGGSYAGLISSGNTLYGTAYYGGSLGNGTVFAINTDGTGFRTLHSFGGGSGENPHTTLALSSNTLFGTTSHTANFSGNGTIFAVNTDGTGFTLLHTLLSMEGSVPDGGLYLSGNTLYGTTVRGGASGWGTVFRVQTDGTGFTVLHSFRGLTDGEMTFAGVVLSGSTLYGSTGGAGGSPGYGTIFSISLAPHLTMTPSGANVLLSWPTSFTGFTLQSTTNLVSPVWTTNLPPPVILNGQNTVTNAITGTEQFFRLND